MITRLQQFHIPHRSLTVWAWWRKRKNSVLTTQVHQVDALKEAPHTPFHGTESGARAYELPEAHGLAEVG